MGFLTGFIVGAGVCYFRATIWNKTLDGLEWAWAKVNR